MNKYWRLADKITYYLPIYLLAILFVYIFLKSINYFLNLLF